MSKRYDIVVAGAGPAGIMAAKTAAENGLRVALLERKTTIAKIFRVDAGAIGVNEALFGQRVTFNQQGGRLCFPDSGFAIAYDGPYTNIYGFQIYSPCGRRLIFGDWQVAQGQGDSRRVGIALSKEAMLEGLLQEAESCHVDVCAGTNITGITHANGHVQVHTDRGSLEGIFVIAADGVNSRIGQLTGLNKERKFQGTMKYFGYEIEGELPVDDGSFNFILSEKGNFALTPTFRDSVYHLGIFSFNTKVQLKSVFEDFLTADPTYSPWFHKTKRIKTQACVVNEFSPVKVPYKDNVLFIGDTVWSREFSNMAALISGWKAGNAVTLAMIDNKYSKEGIEPYLAWWHEQFYAPYGDIEFATFDFQDFLAGEEIDYLTALVTQPFPATMNFYTLFDLIGNAYAELFPQIEHERPEIMEKLLSMRSQFDELAAQQRKRGFPNR